MTDQATTAAPISRLRCIQCGAVRDTADQDFRCPECGDLFEAFFPGWVTSSGPRAGGMSAPELKERWLQRKLSLVPLDQSGVWRFRELLPALTDWNDVITLREGNTPLYRLQRCAHSAGVQTLFAKHQGMNPTGSFKDTGMTWRPQEPSPNSRGKDFVEQTFAISRLRGRHMPIEDRL